MRSHIARRDATALLNAALIANQKFISMLESEATSPCTGLHTDAALPHFLAFCVGMAGGEEEEGVGGDGEREKEAKEEERGGKEENEERSGIVDGEEGEVGTNNRGSKSLC